MDGYKVSYTGKDESGNEINAYKLFNADKTKLSQEDSVCYGIALTGVSAKVDNMVLKDSVGNILYNQNETITPEVIDVNNLLNVTESKTTLVLDQVATTGKTAQSITNGAVNASYYVFPKTANNQSMSMDLVVKDYYMEGNAAKSAGVYVGAFQIDSPEKFVSISFRNPVVTGDDSLSPIWIKSSGLSGNGKPKYKVEKDVTYHITFEKTDEKGYVVSFTNLSTGVSDVKQFKASEAMLTQNEEVYFGIELIGTKVEVQNLTLKNENGTVIYDQNE